MSKLGSSAPNLPLVIALLEDATNLDVSVSDNQTTYFEWDSTEGFISLEVGSTKYGFSFIPSPSSTKPSFGETGALTDLVKLEQLIKEYK